MHNKNERLVSLIAVWLTKSPNCDHPHDLTKLLEVVAEEFRGERAIGYVVGTDVVLDEAEATDLRDVIYIADIRELDDRITFLFHRGMPNESAPNWVNTKLKKVLSLSPNDSDAVPARSAHLTVLKGNTSRKGGKVYFRCGYERIMGVSRLLMLTLMRSLLLRYAKEHQEEFVFKVYDRQKKREVEKIYQPGIGALAHPSQSLTDSIEKGRLLV